MHGRDSRDLGKKCFAMEPQLLEIVGHIDPLIIYNVEKSSHVKYAFAQDVKSTRVRHTQGLVLWRSG